MSSISVRLLQVLGVPEVDLFKQEDRIVTILPENPYKTEALRRESN